MFAPVEDVATFVDFPIDEMFVLGNKFVTYGMYPIYLTLLPFIRSLCGILRTNKIL